MSEISGQSGAAIDQLSIMQKLKPAVLRAWWDRFAYAWCRPPKRERRLQWHGSSHLGKTAVMGGKKKKLKLFCTTKIN
uniref:Uncharacterized protein n=1 Tax=Anguilla anguilla TaxID=7936 RepID=A0A0E9WYN0_ANGAN